MENLRGELMSVYSHVSVKSQHPAGYLQTLLLYIYIKKIQFLYFVFGEETTGKRVESMAVNHENSTEWDFTVRGILLWANTPIADALMKTIVLKENFEKVGLCVCVGVDTDTLHLA